MLRSKVLTLAADPRIARRNYDYFWTTRNLSLRLADRSYNVIDYCPTTATSHAHNALSVTV